MLKQVQHDKGNKMTGFVYIMSNKKRGTLYVGVTSDLIKRVCEHKNKLVDGFTKRHDLNILVYYEQAETIEAAISREKQLKNWHRAWKINLIEDANPGWNDLYKDIASS
jgi:putative endonuclease